MFHSRKCLQITLNPFHFQQKFVEFFWLQLQVDWGGFAISAIYRHFKVHGSSSQVLLIAGFRSYWQLCNEYNIIKHLKLGKLLLGRWGT